MTTYLLCDWLGSSVLLLEARDELYLERNAAFKCSSRPEIGNTTCSTSKYYLAGDKNRSCKVCFFLKAAEDLPMSGSLVCNINQPMPDITWQVSTASSYCQWLDHYFSDILISKMSENRMFRPTNPKMIKLQLHQRKTLNPESSETFFFYLND